MTTQVNATVDQLAQQLTLDKRRAEIQAMAAGYVFTKSKDDVGLPHEHPRYVKKSCKSCHGRGYQIQYFNGGARIQIGEAGDGAGGGKHFEHVQRLYQACKCQIARYNSVRNEVEQIARKQVMAALKVPVSEVPEAELASIMMDSRRSAASLVRVQYGLD